MRHRRKITYGIVFYPNTKSDFNVKRPLTILLRIFTDRLLLDNLDILSIVMYNYLINTEKRKAK